MTQAVARILSEVDELSMTELTELRREIVERTPMTEDLTEQDFAVLAAEMFQQLDDEEASGNA